MRALAGPVAITRPSRARMLARGGAVVRRESSPPTGTPGNVMFGRQSILPPDTGSRTGARTVPKARVCAATSRTARPPLECTCITTSLRSVAVAVACRYAAANAEPLVRLRAWGVKRLYIVPMSPCCHATANEWPARSAAGCERAPTTSPATSETTASKGRPRRVSRRRLSRRWSVTPRVASTYPSGRTIEPVTCVIAVTALDWLLVVFVIAMGLWGFVQGLIVGALSLVGFAAGAVIGARVAPLLLKAGSHSPYTPLFALLGAILVGRLR